MLEGGEFKNSPAVSKFSSGRLMATLPRRKANDGGDFVRIKLCLGAFPSYLYLVS